MFVRAVVMAAIVAGLVAPVPASAEDPSPVCVPVPVDTIGAHVVVGDEEVHVPAISNAQLCAVVWPVVGEQSPVGLTVYPFCGFPCFMLVVEDGGWAVAGTRAAVYLTYETDGAPTYAVLADVPVTVGIDNPNEVCVAVGNPIPDCPPGSFAVPVPAP